MLLLPPGGLSSFPVPKATHSVIPYPSPFARGRDLCSSNHHLAPTVASLVCSSLDVLSEGFSGWRESIYCSTLLGEELLTRVVDMLVVASTIVQETTKRSKVSRLSSTIEGVGVAPKAPEVTVASSHTFHVSHAVFLLLPPKLDTVSHPVKA